MENESFASDEEDYHSVGPEERHLSTAPDKICTRLVIHIDPYIMPDAVIPCDDALRSVVPSKLTNALNMHVKGRRSLRQSLHVLPASTTTSRPWTTRRRWPSKRSQHSGVMNRNANSCNKSPHHDAGPSPAMEMFDCSSHIAAHGATPYDKRLRGGRVKAQPQQKGIATLSRFRQKLRLAQQKG
jgi:hypothetical protein